VVSLRIEAPPANILICLTAWHLQSLPGSSVVSSCSARRKWLLVPSNWGSNNDIIDGADDKDALSHRARVAYAQVRKSSRVTGSRSTFATSFRASIYSRAKRLRGATLLKASWSISVKAGRSRIALDGLPAAIVTPGHEPKSRELDQSGLTTHQLRSHTCRLRRLPGMTDRALRLSLAARKVKATA